MPRYVVERGEGEWSAEQMRTETTAAASRTFAKRVSVTRSSTATPAPARDHGGREARASENETERSAP
jgi:hypothetical protein